MAPGWRDLRRPLIVDGLLPLLAYLLIRPHVGSDATGLVAILAFPAADAAVLRFRGRPADPIGLIALAAVALTLLGTLVLDGSELVLKLRPSATTGLFGLGCLASLALPQPAMFHIGRQFAARGDRTLAAELDDLAKVPIVAHAIRRLTIGWALGLLLQAALIVDVAFDAVHLRVPRRFARHRLVRACVAAGGHQGKHPPGRRPPAAGQRRTVSTKRTAVAANGIVGALHEPVGGPPIGRIIVLPGSEGGIPDAAAAELSKSTGAACLALAYFGRRTPRRRLVEVPLETVDTAAAWLQNVPAGGRSDRVGLLGASKGAELALLAASELPDRYGPVAAIAPSSVAWAGVEFLALDRRFFAGIFGTASTRSSWTVHGEPIRFLHHAPGVLPTITPRGISVSRSFEVALDNDHAPLAEIAIERAAGPILLISGGRDRMWPAERMAEALVARAERAGRSDRLEHLSFPDAGHQLGPQGPATLVKRLSSILDYGGTAQANVAARRHTWTKITAFFRPQFAPSEGT